MSEFILEEALEQVKNKTTKYYLQEVVSCYNNKNYRATVTVLYTILIYDLLQKVIVLKDIYKFENAYKILDKFKESQKSNSKDPSWEGNLIEHISRCTELITEAEKEELLYIKKMRNLAAHPIINGINSFEEIELKVITRETAMDLIRKAFEIVFMRDAILGKASVGNFIDDLREFYVRVKDDGLESYLNSKYFSRMTQSRKDILFKALWKFVFLINDDECKKNRASNLCGLICLYNENRQHYLELIRTNETHYSDKLTLETFKSFSEEFEPGLNYVYIGYFEIASRIISFTTFLKQCPEVYRKLNAYAKNIIQTSINHLYMDFDVIDVTVNIDSKENCEFFKKQLEAKAEAIFLVEDVTKHFKDVIKMIENYCVNPKKMYGMEINNWSVLTEENLRIMWKQCEYLGCTKEFLFFIIHYCGNAQTYYQASYLFGYAAAYFEYFDKSTFYELLTKMSNNSQFCENPEKNKMLKELEEYFKQKFDSPLVATIEEKYLYDPLYEFNLNGEYSVCEILDLLEKRYFYYLPDTLKQKVFELLRHKQNAEVLQGKDKHKYVNIEKCLIEKHPDFVEIFYDFFD